MADKPVAVEGREQKGDPTVPGDPVEMPALSQMGGTFAERKKAREAQEKKAKAVSSSSAENKAVKAADSK